MQLRLGTFSINLTSLSHKLILYVFTSCFHISNFYSLILFNKWAKEMYNNTHFYVWHTYFCLIEKTNQIRFVYHILLHCNIYHILMYIYKLTQAESSNVLCPTISIWKHLLCRRFCLLNRHYSSFCADSI